MSPLPQLSDPNQSLIIFSILTTDHNHCLVIADTATPNYELITDPANGLPKEFATPSQAKIYTFDLKLLFHTVPTLQNWLTNSPVYDLMLAGFLENGNLACDLGSLAKRIGSTLSQPPAGLEDTGEISSNSDWQKYIVEMVQLYIALSKHFESNIQPKIHELWTKIESPLAVVLAKMESTGIFINQPRLQEISNELKLRSHKLEQEIKDILATPDLNPNSPSQLGTALLNFGFDLKAGKSGKISTDKSVLEELQATDTSGVIEKIGNYRTLSKLNSTFAESFLDKLDAHSRLRGQFTQVQAATGRLSSNQPNLQNIPIRHPEFGPLLRSCFAAPEGRMILSADYSQVELRLLAHFCGDPLLLDTFEKNQDIHARTAAEIFDTPLEEVTHTQRRLGKTLNFALLYQQGPFATAKQLGITVAEAKSFIEKYFAKFTKVKEFIQSTLDFARANGFVETIYGRRRYFDNIVSGNFQLRALEERAAFNAVLQGSNADLIKDAMIKLQNKIELEKLPASLILQVHDELVLEADKSQIETIKATLVECMELGQPLKVPLVVDAGYGQNWGESK